jgi:hypothetical protein
MDVEFPQFVRFRFSVTWLSVSTNFPMATSHSWHENGIIHEQRYSTVKHGVKPSISREKSSAHSQIRAISDRWNLGPGLIGKEISMANGMILRSPKISSEAQSLAPKKKLVVARQFLMSFRQRPDDLYLMDKYSLSPKQLKKVYNALIEKGWMEEYEYHTRDRKAPELEEPTIHLGDTSTSVTVKGSFSEDTLELFRSESKLNLPQPGGTGRPQSVAQGGRVSGPKSAGASGKVKLVHHEDLCPNCRGPKHPSSPDSCISCGVVFSKYAALKKGTAVPIWDMDSEL